MTSEKAKMLSGGSYDPADPQLRAERRIARQLVRLFNATGPTEHERRRTLLSTLFGSGGETAAVEPPFYCDYGGQIHVGEDFFANFGCVFLDVCEIRFGDQCMLGPAVHV
ncbi:MAG: maltose acetyltransferase domain-containing protein, partial [Halapricum sp.]